MNVKRLYHKYLKFDMLPIETGATRSRSYRAFSREVRLRGLDAPSTKVDASTKVDDRL